jgi:hypothetical protein
MKRITAILLLTAAGLLAACNSPASSPGATTPLESFPAVSAEPSMDVSAEPSMDVSPSVVP